MDTTLVISIIAIIVMLFISPLTTFFIIAVVGVPTAVALFLVQSKRNNLTDKSSVIETQRRNRILALEQVKLFLAPYKDIWRNLRLSNKFVDLKLGSDGVTITAREKYNPHGSETVRNLKVLKTNEYPTTELWNMFCMYFDHQTTYDRLIELCKIFKVSIKEDISLYSSSSLNYNRQKSVAINENANNNPEIENMLNKKLDINNASEIEITALPGISIVMAKKLIQKRESIKGFKSVDDVILFLHIKPHIEKQLRPIICVNKMQGSLKIARSKERKVDL